MPKQWFNDERLTQLRELLDIQYEKIHEYEKAIDMSDGVSQKIALRQQIKRDIVPRIREVENEYASLLTNSVDVAEIPDAEAQQLISELVGASDQLRRRTIPEPPPSEILELLREIEKKLGEPGKSAAAKLKVVLPIIPLVASYELEIDTGNVLVKSWRAICGLFERTSRSQIS
jgi:hypothetical protein